MKRHIFPIVGIVLGMLFIFPSTIHARGHFEIRPFYGMWSLNLVRRPIENALTRALESNIRSQVSDDFSTAVLQSLTDVSFDSNGTLVGLELRWYPSGENGVWSLGIGIERTSFEVTARGESTLFLEGDIRVDLIPAGTIRLEVPLVFLTSQWTLFPSWRFRPYIGLGAGISPLRGTLTYSAVGVATYEGIIIPYGYSETTQLEDIQDLQISVIPYVIGYAGIQGQIFPFAYLSVDAGILNGFMVRFTASIRF